MRQRLPTQTRVLLHTLYVLLFHEKIFSNCRNSQYGCQSKGSARMARWTLLTKHGAVLILLARHGQITTRRMAEMLGITERLIHRIIVDLEADGYLSKQRVGRVNHDQVHVEKPLQRSGIEEVTVGEMLQGFGVRTRT